MTNNLINGGGGTSGACRLSSSTLPSILIVIVLICIQVREVSVSSVANFTYIQSISVNSNKTLTHSNSKSFQSNFRIAVVEVGNTVSGFTFSFELFARLNILLRRKNVMVNMNTEYIPN